MIYVNGIKIKTPSVFEWGLQDISSDEAGRVELNDKMYKNRTSQKVKLNLVWNNPTKEQASEILKAFNPEYFKVTYPDAMTGKDETKEFYCGDRSAPMKRWVLNQKLYSSVSFNIIER